MGARLAANLDVDVLACIYRLAPEHPFPAALDDALAAYEYLLAEGYDPSDIVFAGESAGGGLCLALAFKLRELGMAMPRCVYLMSPWVDLSCSLSAECSQHGSDPSLKFIQLQDAAKMYASGTPLDDPFVSPLFGSFSGLPPVLIQLGDHEILHDEVFEMARKMRAAEVSVRLQIGHGMWHVFQAFDCPESKTALRHARRFIALCATAANRPY
jgi:acetyl esterase/lipase